MRMYQPERPDLLVNTGWGIAAGQLSKEDAKARGLKLFNGRWVTPDEKKQLRREYHAYLGIRNMAALFLLIPIIVLLYVLAVILPGLIGPEWTTLLPLIIPVAICAGSLRIWQGLRRFRNWARILVTALMAAVIITAVTVWVYDWVRDADMDTFVRGYAWLVWVVLLPLIPVYYLNNSTARKIFNQPAGSESDTGAGDREIDNG